MKHNINYKLGTSDRQNDLLLIKYELCVFVLFAYKFQNWNKLGIKFLK